ncbi:RNF4 ligase, partial [Mystacornis crossleyi]|nr:RNF4 ligase [Mystacornis crossleyi]
QDREQSQQQLHASRASENSAELLARDDEEEPRDTDEYLHVLSGSVPSSAQQGVVIRCPICMDVYSEIVQSGRLLVATMCGHVFCSECLPVALEPSHMCPTCRVDLSPELYHSIFL